MRGMLARPPGAPENSRERVRTSLGRRGSCRLFASKMKVSLLAAAIGVVLVVGVVLAVTFSGAGPARSAAALSTPAASTPAATHSASHKPAPPPPPPLQVESATPASGTHDVNGADPVQV